MSAAPRPYNIPSSMVGSNGGEFHLQGAGGDDVCMAGKHEVRRVCLPRIAPAPCPQVMNAVCVYLLCDKTEVSQ